MHAPAQPQPRPTLLALIVAAAFFMEILDGAIISPAIPQIAESFNSTAVAVSTGISSYLITVAIFIPASAWLSDRFGPRAVFASAIAVFTVASVANTARGYPIASAHARCSQAQSRYSPWPRCCAASATACSNSPSPASCRASAAR
jgi:predicted MFS family arabinose efflux permease